MKLLITIATLISSTCLYASDISLTGNSAKALFDYLGTQSNSSEYNDATGTKYLIRTLGKIECSQIANDYRCSSNDVSKISLTENDDESVMSFNFDDETSELLYDNMPTKATIKYIILEPMFPNAVDKSDAPIYCRKFVDGTGTFCTYFHAL